VNPVQVRSVGSDETSTVQHSGKAGYNLRGRAFVRAGLGNASTAKFLASRMRMGVASVSSSAAFMVNRQTLRAYFAPAHGANQFALHNV
jgi:urocanate hydratase